VTGITGQDGSYLAELLLSKGYEVWGLVRGSAADQFERLAALIGDARLDPARMRLVEGDLTDSESLLEAIRQSRPHEVYNLAAKSQVQESFDRPEEIGEVVGLAVVRILEGIRQLQPDARYCQAGTAALYGGASESPQTEATPIAPCSPYSAAKAYAYFATQVYRAQRGLFASNAILFNHESPRRREGFVTRKITLGVAQIRAGRLDCLRLGNLNARRDWGFAGDFVQAMWLMLQADRPDDFVIATGEIHTVREFCELAFVRAGLPLTWTATGVDEQGIGPDGRILVQVDPDFFRPGDPLALTGNAAKARRELGWAPTMRFKELVQQMVDADLRELKVEG
jgi:GDPmannose 4,6-dehydratase